MAKSKKRLASIILGVCLGLFLVIDFITGVFSPDQWAFSAALATCRENGWRDGDLVGIKSDISGWLLGKTARIELKTKDQNQPKTIHLTLRKPINLLGWHVVDYKEEPPER
jgi:hypothetical protein